MQVNNGKEIRRRLRGHKAPRFPRSSCPVANLLDLVGDKWSLLVVRDLFYGHSTYGQLADSPERIPTNILAERLKRMEKGGLISKTPYQRRPVRYTYKLTQKGKDLGKILAELARWGEKHVPGARRRLLVVDTPQDA